MRQGIKNTVLLFVLAVWAGAACAEQTLLEVISLRYRTAEQMIPMLQPLLAPGGTLSGMQGKLIIRTTPQNLAELRKVLDAVDTMPKRLLVSVRQESADSGLDSESEVSGSVGSDRARVSVPGSPGKDGATVELRRGQNVARARTITSQSAATDRTMQTVQVIEGNEAFIRVGQSVPIRSGSVTVTLLGSQIANSAEYRDADTGFRVRPRVTGDQVALEISTRRDRVADPNVQSFDIQRIDTVVSGRLGQWMEIGGIIQTRSQTEGASVSRRTGNQSDDRRVFLKVEMTP
jgi:type II secretory pathway component GspD/PulD (secretin)